MLISCGEIRVSMLVFGCLVSCTPTPRKHFPSLGLFKTWGGFFFFQAQFLIQGRRRCFRFRFRQ